VNNVFIDGPDHTSSSDYGQLSTPDTFYAVGNVSDSNRDGIFNPTISNPVSSTDSRYSATPLHATTNGLPTLSVTDAYAYVLAHAGASLSRDQLDQLVIGQVQTLGSGSAGYTAGTTGPTSTTVPFDTVHDGLYWKAYLTGLDNGGLGTTASSSRPAGFDADNDGVADSWEAIHGMNSANASDALALNPLGYRMIEQYINELGAQNDTRSSIAGASGDWNTASNWNGSVVPGAYDYAQVRGNAGTAGSLNLSSGTATAMELSIGGGGSAAGENVTVSGGKLSVYDTITVGDQNTGALVLNSGTINAFAIQLGNTLSGTTTNGSLVLNGGVLETSIIALGGGTPAHGQLAEPSRSTVAHCRRRGR